MEMIQNFLREMSEGLWKTPVFACWTEEKDLLGGTGREQPKSRVNLREGVAQIPGI